MQDNMSAMKLETNGKASSLMKTKHIHIRFFMKDRINQGGISIKYCPTEQIWVEIQSFYKVLPFFMRAQLMNCLEDYCEQISCVDGQVLFMMSLCTQTTMMESKI